ncbi:MAG: hypothetical protein GTN89_12765 [Acidobacteria bacterium]|nr:hypothetical protein [Acidobacteriota bacterium]NIM63876.1 hypothetical protein [Acidobacteriota bacterium]NIO60145.1 hypothetical protein [Acidobacteriota bacterium]NIQ31209.1 hypothetical protein [Acidobacteriota bacterium]NIQ86346.1 hypothetical protein [Acidobacteriota bacterium]
MHNSRKVIPACALACALLVSAPASAGGLDSFLAEIDVTASADLGAFKADLSLSFNVSDREVDGLFRVMSDPSDVYMCLRIGELADQPIEKVVAEHREHKGQGWGVIAKNLGIKPGSAEFHALKAGRLSSHSGGGKNHKGKGRGR